MAKHKMPSVDEILANPPPLKKEAVERVATHWARLLIQIEMKKRDMTYRDLTMELNKMLMMENERNVRNKIARGTFSGGFFLMCMVVMGCKTLDFHSAFDDFDKLVPKDDKSK